METGYGGWRITTTNEKVYHPRASDEELSIALGQTGQFVLYFEVPRSLQINDAQICYRGQEPYSFGKLTGGQKVAAYDWDTEKVMQETQVSGELYSVPDELGRTSTRQLTTVARWSGTESKVINFTIDKSPWVINAKIEVVSSLGYNFQYYVFTEDEYTVPELSLIHI